jgi:cell division protein FtsL
MAVDLGALMAKLKSLPRPLKIVCAVILADLLALGGTYFIYDDLLSDQQAEVDQLRGQFAQARRQNTELHRQITQYPQLVELFEAARRKGMLDSLDRMKLVNDAQAYASDRRIGSLHYKLDPEDVKTEAGAKYRLTTTQATFEGGALLDGDAMAFWDDLLGNLPSHYKVTEASLERLRDVNPPLLAEIRAGHPVSLVGVKLSFRWSGLRPAAQDTP